jgi:hypothetical protein
VIHEAEPNRRKPSNEVIGRDVIHEAEPNKLSNGVIGRDVIHEAEPTISSSGEVTETCVVARTRACFRC